MNNNYAIVFPGQGSQSVGMLGEFLHRFKIVKNTFEEASDAGNLKSFANPLIFKSSSE